jgi:elongation factor Ts
MAEITAALVKQLRESTGAGMMDCKKALNETDGDMDAATDWLRTKGLASAAKKAGRIAAEGLVGVAVDGARGAVVEVNAETDFVGRNADFQAMVSNVATVALDNGADVEALAAASYPGGGTVGDAITDLIAKIGENMTLRRSALIQVGSGVVASYVHTAVAEGLGRIGVIVGLESTGDADKLAAFGKQLAMHIAAASPQWLDRDGVDPAAIEREREVLTVQAKESGRPDNVIEKMVEGRLRKFFEESCLLEQVFVIDGESKISKAVEAAGKDAGAPVRVTGFARFALGEGIERKEEDFAAEVAKTLKS